MIKKLNIIILVLLMTGILNSMEQEIKQGCPLRSPPLQRTRNSDKHSEKQQSKRREQAKREQRRIMQKDISEDLSLYNEKK